MGRVEPYFEMAKPKYHNAIQKLGRSKEEDSVVRTLNESLSLCKNRIANVEMRGEDAIRPIGDSVDEYGREVLKLDGLIPARKSGEVYVTT